MINTRWDNQVLIIFPINKRHKRGITTNLNVSKQIMNLDNHFIVLALDTYNHVGHSNNNYDHRVFNASTLKAMNLLHIPDNFVFSDIL